jgi:hypothetical protein
VRKTNHSIKLFIVLILCTTYVFSFSQLGVQAINLLGSKNSQFSSGTSIATVDISGKTENEALDLLNAKIPEWVNNSKLYLQINDVVVPIIQFQFNYENTLQNVKDGQKNKMVVTFDHDTFLNELNAIDFPVNYEEIDMDKLVTDITNIASELKTGEHLFNLAEYLGANYQNKLEVLGDSIILPKNIPADLEPAIDKLKTIKVNGQATFSFLKYLENQGLLTISATSKNIIASGIYQAILPTNFVIIEKNTSRELPTDIPLGYEAKIDGKKNIDFVFSNPNETSYTLNLKWESNGLQVTVSGNKFINSYKIKTDEIEYFSPKTVKQFSPLLKTGEKKLGTEGKKGVLIKVYREEYKNNQLVHKELISEDFYPPIHQIEIHPLAERSTSEELNQSNQESQQIDEETGVDELIPDSAELNTKNSADPNESDLFGKPNETSK